jgi:formylglycine-generating enzyme required for sulfatase activity
LLCYRCGSHVPDTSESCGTCGQKLAGGGVRQATATFSRRRPQGALLENAPYKRGDVVANRYEIKDAVGAGPVGVVFRAHDREVEVEVALKVLNHRLLQTAEERRGFGKVMRLGRKLSHQNLVRVYEEGEDQERPFFAMQFLEGLTLRRIIDLRIQKGELFTLREVEPILGQIAAALDSAHKVGTHSNLKPENVIVLPDLLKVSDFGLALAMPRLPFVQATKGRKADRYLAPEYAQGHEVDPRADIYSLGVILGEMLSGLTPDGAVPELLARNPALPPQVEGLYRRALNSNPLARPKSAGALLEELAEITRKVSPPPLGRAPAPQVTAAGATAMLELRRRGVDKPPPPVPEDLVSEEVDLDGSSANVLSGEVTRLDGRVIPDGPPPPPAAVPALDREETALMPSFPGDLPDVDPLGEPTQSRFIGARRSYAWVLFGLITVFGLAAGGGGGYWYLGKVRGPVPALAVQASPESPAQPPPSPPAPVETAVAVAPPTSLQPAAAPAPASPPKPVIEPKRADPGARAADEARRREEARRLAEEAELAEDRRRIEAAAQAALEKRRAQEAEEKRLADEKRGAEEKRAAEEKRRAPVVAAATVTTPVKRAGECPDGMRHVPAGSFRMGTARDDPMMGFDERILSAVEVSDFCIDTFEFPNRRGAIPRINVSWNDAKRLCEGQGKRLCSEEEWEKACKGPGNARFPYGNTFDADACNTEDELGEDRPLAPAGRFGKCRSGYGVADMSGNVAEWTSSPYAGNPDKAQKGGSHTRADYASRCSARRNGSPTSKGGDVGFRCCSDP